MISAITPKSSLKVLPSNLTPFVLQPFLPTDNRTRRISCLTVKPRSNRTCPQAVVAHWRTSCPAYTIQLPSDDLPRRSGRCQLGPRNLDLRWALFYINLSLWTLPLYKRPSLQPKKTRIWSKQPDKPGSMPTSRTVISQWVLPSVAMTTVVPIRSCTRDVTWRMERSAPQCVQKELLQWRQSVRG